MRWRLRVLWGLVAVMATMMGGQAMARTEGKSVQEVAVFAGGCFWCMESEFQSEKGVLGVVSGYTGGHVENPTYEQVSGGKTGHREAVQVAYDPAEVSYARLLEIFWSNVDPLDATGQFCDKGEQYKAAIYVGDENERRLAEASAEAVGKRLGRQVVTDILPRGRFWAAEEYHQDYYKKRNFQYQLYRAGCGRDARLREIREMQEE